MTKSRVALAHPASDEGPVVDTGALFIERCRRRDPAAFAQLYRQHAGPIQRHLCVLLRNGDVDDAVQAVFTEAYRGIHRFRGEASLSTWLHGIAYRVALMQLRSRRRRRRALSTFAEIRQPTSIDVENAVGARQQTERISTVMHQLSPKRQLAFTLYYIEDLDIQEVALRMGVSVDTAWARVQRARRQLLAAMEKQQSRAERRSGVRKEER